MQPSENTPKTSTLEYVLTDAEKDLLRKITDPLQTLNAQLTAVVSLLRAQHGMSPNAQLTQDFSRLAEPQPPKE